MKFKFPIILLIISAFSFGFQKPPTRIKQVINKEEIRQADKLLKKYHLGQKHANNIVKVVYFHANDQKPLPNWRERLTRTLEDVSKFYQEELDKYDIKNEGIPFEKNQGKYVFHVIQGASQSKVYTQNSGMKIQNEIYIKSNKQIDFSKDYVLIINGLCDKKADGSYMFHSPYHGTGNSIRGVCHVADCELLDSKLLTDTTRKMAFSEMLIDHKKCGVAEFNSWYIGGIAHELGHVFGLPHDFGNPLELDSTSISLMGQYGSRHFRDYLWGGTPSSFFSAASVLQLMSQPVFTQSNRLRSVTSKFDISNIQFSRNKWGLVLKMDMKTEVLPYGVVVLVRPTFESEYLNRSFSKFITSSDSLNIEIGFLANGNYALRLLYLFPNGIVADFSKAFSVDANGVAVEIESNTGVVNIGNFCAKLQKMEKTPVIQQKIEILQAILNPPKPVDLKTYDGAKLYLSDAEWEKASVGWENVARNYYTCESEHTFFLENQGKLYSKGLFAHSPSSYIFNLNKKWQKFSAIVGLRDFANIEGSARFTVLGDGKILYESPALRVNQQSVLSIDVKDVMILELKTNATEGYINNSWAVWLNPLLER
jgi:NPCBM/NEW2 domain